MSGDGLIESPPVFQGIAEIAVGFGIIGLQSDGLTDQTNRNVAVSHLKGNNSEMVHRMNMFRLSGQDLPIKLLGFAQTPGLVVLDRQPEGLLGRELSHEQGNPKYRQSPLSLTEAYLNRQ